MLRRRRYPASPPATPLDEENLLAECLLRLPPRPSSLPRAGAVCKAWRRVVTDPHFLHRFRAHHGKAPLLGYFDVFGRFFPTLEAPDRVPSARLSVGMVGWYVKGCRDGLVLRTQGSKLQVLDPMTGHRSAILIREDKLPIPLDVELVVHSTGVERLCFRLFALSMDADRTKLSVSVYSSDSGAWVHSGETLVSQSSFLSKCLTTFVGNAFYWLHMYGGIIRYDLETQTLAIIETPLNNEEDYDNLVMIMTKDGLVSIAILDNEDEFTIQLWVRETIPCAAKRMLRKTIRPDTLLPLPLEQYERKWFTAIAGFEEENNVVFLTSHVGLFMFNLESMITRVSEEGTDGFIYPYKIRDCRIQ